ncbi:hypothetical protein RND71_029048 [Anisodus tanguticus]|uniref:Uncharacterized protein n=1 Tax=Anisodus tanguticus TaxID=243964 RepID=A0AAE1V6T7_9SOLA|nr:hypothetical protein RND71_029048 [Anisodus tanguticus]
MANEELGEIVDFLRTREVGEFLSGALVGAMTKAVLAPLETIRTRMVVGVGSRNIGTSFVQVIEQQGWQGRWVGNTINMLRIIPTQAIELGTFECVKRAMTSTQEKLRDTGCPKIQIVVSTLACHSLESAEVIVLVARENDLTFLVLIQHASQDRLTVNPKVYPSLRIVVHKIYKEGGIGGLYAGLGLTLIGMLPYSTCKNLESNTLTLFGSDLLELYSDMPFCGLPDSTISYPLEVARKRLMVGALQGKCPPNMVAALSEVIREEGFLGLYRGWGASCLKVMPSSGITWTFYEAWKDILLADRRYVLWYAHRLRGRQIPSNFRLSSNVHLVDALNRTLKLCNGDCERAQ